jgi:hypothetical protein
MVQMIIILSPPFSGVCSRRVVLIAPANNLHREEGHAAVADGGFEMVAAAAVDNVAPP